MSEMRLTKEQIKELIPEIVDMILNSDYASIVETTGVPAIQIQGKDSHKLFSVLQKLLDDKNQRREIGHE
jgi:hypothetical protein